MKLDNRLYPHIYSLVHELVLGNFETLEIDGRSGRCTASELRSAIIEYGRELVDITQENIELAEVYAVNEEPGAWAIDLPLQTIEEGRSDLTLSFTLIETEIGPNIEIDDLHVL